MGRVEESATDHFGDRLLVAEGAAPFDRWPDIVQRVGIMDNRVKPLRGQIARVEEIGHTNLRTAPQGKEANQQQRGQLHGTFFQGRTERGGRSVAIAAFQPKWRIC